MQNVQQSVLYELFWEVPFLRIKTFEGKTVCVANINTSRGVAKNEERKGEIHTLHVPIPRVPGHGRFCLTHIRVRGRLIRYCLGPYTGQGTVNVLTHSYDGPIVTFCVILLQFNCDAHSLQAVADLTGGPRPEEARGPSSTKIMILSKHHSFFMCYYT